MELTLLINEVNEIFITLLEDNSIVLNEQTTNEDVELWDSLNHIQIITAIEKKYNILFEMNELLNFSNIGDMCRCILQKTNTTTSIAG
jgi:acyl carrier protein